MTALLRCVFLSAVAGVLLVALTPRSAPADDYWDGYWSWYDTTYRPYYYRQYVTPYRSGYTYGNTVYGYPGYAYPYAPRYYGYGPPAGVYFGGPNIGYRDFGPYGGQVRVGPVRFGWR